MTSRLTKPLYRVPIPSITVPHVQVRPFYQAPNRRPRRDFFCLPRLRRRATTTPVSKLRPFFFRPFSFLPGNKTARWPGEVLPRLSVLGRASDCVTVPTDNPTAWCLRAWCRQTQ